MQTTNRKCDIGSKGKKSFGSSALENKPMQSGKAERPTQYANIIPVVTKDGDWGLQLAKKVWLKDHFQRDLFSLEYVMSCCFWCLWKRDFFYEKSPSGSQLVGEPVASDGS